MEEQKDEIQESPTSPSENWKQWLQDNLRVIVSIVIVILIAGGIYSYSKRSNAPTGENVSSSEKTPAEQLQEIISDKSEEKVSVEKEKKNEEEKKEKTIEVKQEEKTATTGTSETSKETETSFIETAQKGNGVTHLARRALADYLEKNPDSELKAEHKIYIEDYLRKKVGFSDRVFTGTTIEFDKDLIKGAIESSKKLNEAQINNLHKYAVRVSSLS